MSTTLRWLGRVDYEPPVTLSLDGERIAIRAGRSRQSWHGLPPFHQLAWLRQAAIHG